jgi:hypothetical protein
MNEDKYFNLLAILGFGIGPLLIWLWGWRKLLPYMFPNRHGQSGR